MSATTAPLNVTEAIEEALVSDDLDKVALLYAQAKERTDAWRKATGEIEKHLHAVMEGHGVKRHELAGIGMVEASRRTKRTGWRHDDLLGDIARKVADNRRLLDSGELEPAEWVMARLVTKCLSLSGGKVTGLREVGLQVDEYCEVGESEPSVRLVGFDTPEVTR